MIRKTNLNKALSLIVTLAATIISFIFLVEIGIKSPFPNPISTVFLMAFIALLLAIIFVILTGATISFVHYARQLDKRRLQ